MLIASNGERLTGLIALINSIDKNTNSPIFFHLVSDAEGAVHIRLWMDRAPELRHIKREIIVFDQKVIQGKGADDKVKSIFDLSNPVSKTQ